MAERRYAPISILLHWLTAALVTIQIVLGLRMPERSASPEAFALFQAHKSVGILILLLTLLRLGWRLVAPPPPLPDGLNRMEARLAKTAHVLFYVALIALPLTGWIMVSTSRIRIPTQLFGQIPWPHLPGLATLEGPAREAWHKAGDGGHGLLLVLMIALLLLHVAGALKHQIDGGPAILSRMLPGVRAGKLMDRRLVAAGLFLVLLAGAAALWRSPPGSVAATNGAGIATSASSSEWQVLPGSRIDFVTAWSGLPFEGHFSRWQADIRFDPDRLETAAIDVRIDMTSASTGDDQRDTALPGADWFDAARWPKARFIATHIRKVGLGRYVANGALTLRGQSRPVALPFTLRIEGDRAEVTGETTIDRTAFGVGAGDFAATTDIPAGVRIKVSLSARRN